MPKDETLSQQKDSGDELIEKLRAKPYSKLCREAADMIEALLREKAAREGRPNRETD